MRFRPRLRLCSCLIRDLGCHLNGFRLFYPLSDHLVVVTRVSGLGCRLCALASEICSLRFFGSPCRRRCVISWLDVSKPLSLKHLLCDRLCRCNHCTNWLGCLGQPSQFDGNEFDPCLVMNCLVSRCLDSLWRIEFPVFDFHAIFGDSINDLIHWLCVKNCKDKFVAR